MLSSLKKIITVSAVFSIHSTIVYGNNAVQKRIYINPFNTTNNTVKFRLFDAGQLSLQQSVEGMLYEKGLDRAFKLKKYGDTIVQSTGNSSEEYQFVYLGKPMCDYFIKAHDVGLNVPLISGKIPLIQLDQVSINEDILDRNTIMENIAAHFQIDQNQIIITELTSCWSDKDNINLGAKAEVIVSQMPYTITLDHFKVQNVEPRFVQIAGKVSGYKVNPKEGSINTATIELSGDKHLTSDKFITTTGNYPRATSATHEFVFDKGDEEFLEVNPFKHVNEIYEWFKTIGYKWHSERLTLRLRQEIPIDGSQTSPNNAVYLPGGFTGKGGPMIALGEGDGQTLDNLHLDSDVVSHEFVHHVVFRTLKSTNQNETIGKTTSEDIHSAAIHEGLADFFVFMKSGDACLGESICPIGSHACIISTKTKSCLRAGDTTLTYGTDFYWDLGASFHLKGQLVSGMLMDIASLPNINKTEFTKLVFMALEYLPSSSTYTDLILALMTADATSFANKYGCMISEGAKKRGFSTVVAKEITKCDAFKTLVPKNDGKTEVEKKSPENTSSPSAGVPSEDESSSSSKKGSSKKCGVIDHQQDSSSPLQVLFAFVLLMTPFALVFGKGRN